MVFVGERAIKRDTKIHRPVVMFQPFPIYNYVQLLVNSSIAQVESSRHSYGHTRLQSPAFKKFADLSNVSVVGGVEIFKIACFVGKADVGINEFPARYDWHITDVQVEESRCQNRSLWQAILLRPP